MDFEPNVVVIWRRAELATIFCRRPNEIGYDAGSLSLAIVFCESAISKCVARVASASHDAPIWSDADTATSTDAGASSTSWKIYRYAFEANRVAGRATKPNDDYDDRPKTIYATNGRRSAMTVQTENTLDVFSQRR